MTIKSKFTKCGTVLTLSLLLGQATLTPIQALAEGTTEQSGQIEEKQDTITNTNETEDKTTTVPLPTLDSTKNSINLLESATNLFSAGGYTSDGSQIVYGQGMNLFSRDTGNSYGKLTKYYSDTMYISIPYISMTGVYNGAVWCVNPDKGFPVNIEYATEVYNDLGIYNILYYAVENGWDQQNENYVDVFVALNAYLGHSYQGIDLNSPSLVNSPNVAYLLQKARDKDAPTGNFDIKNKVQIANFDKTTKLQYTDWYTPVTDGTGVTYDIPTNNFDKEVIVELSDGTQIKGQSGTQTVNANIKFRLLAPANYTKKINFDINTNQRKKAALLFKPTSGDVQELVKGGGMSDPLKVTSVQGEFFARMGQIQIGKQDAITGNMLANTTYEGTIGTEQVKFTTDGQGFSPLSKEYVDGTPYSLVETSVPTGYVLDQTPITGTIKAGEVTKIIQKNNIQKAELTLEKSIEVFNAEETTKQGKPVYDIEPAENIPFTLENEGDTTAPDQKTVIQKAGEYSDTQITDTEGNATFEAFYNGGQNPYKLTEDETPKNYRPMETKTIVKEYGDSSVTAVAYTEKVVNLREKGNLKFNKKNSIDLKNPLNLEKAKFSLKGLPNTPTADVFLRFDSTKETNEINNLPAGTYEVTEIETPNGFEIPTGSTNVKYITIEDNKTLTVDWENQPVTPEKPVIPVIPTPKTPTPVTPVVNKVVSTPTKTTTLPQTGEKDSQWVAVLGATMIVTLAGTIILYKKTKKEA